MEILLAYFDRVGRAVAYDTETGAGHPVRSTERRPREGSAHRHRLRWFAVWPDGEVLYFQAGAHRWRVGGECSLEWSQNWRRRVFRILRGSNLELEVAYTKPLGWLWDITFDETDDEQSDFFLWVRNLWIDPDWQRSILDADLRGSRSDRSRSDPAEK
ncbi:MAG: hypothetical protein RIT81_12880 [Deltaproteobacteria bacterium]